MNVVAIDLLVFAVIWAIGFGARSAWLARNLHRSPAVWAVLGGVTGPIALAILQVTPPGTCAACLSPVHGWSFTCRACGLDVRATPTLAAEAEAEAGAAAPTPLPAGGDVAWPAPLPANEAIAWPQPRPTEDIVVHRAPTPPAGSVPPTAPARTSAPTPTRAPTPTVPTPTVPALVAAPAASSQGVRDVQSNPDARREEGVAPARSHLDLDLQRPIRLASCIFVEGTEALIPGIWYELTSEGGSLRISGPPGSMPNASAMSRRLSDVELKKRGDKLVLTSPGSGTDFRLVFRSTIDWTPLGITAEVDARRRALDVEAAEPTSTPRSPIPVFRPAPTAPPNVAAAPDARPSSPTIPASPVRAGAAAASPAAARNGSEPRASARDGGAVTKGRATVDPARPVRLASGVFLEGSEPLHPGTWYQLATQGQALNITGPLSALPNHETMSRPLAEIRMATRGDRLIVTGTSGALADFRLVFESARDWTSRGVAREVNARRKALGSAAAPGDRSGPA